MPRWILLTLTSIFALTAHVTAQWKVTKPPEKLIGGEGQYFMHPVWSPDGATIAFTEVRYQGLWIANADGSNPRQMSDEAAAGFGFEWSTDSKAIVSRVAKFEGKLRYNAVKLFDVETNESRLLTDYRTSMSGLPHWGDADQKVYMYNGEKLEVFASGKPASAAARSAADERILFVKNGDIAVGSVKTNEVKTYKPVQEGEYLNVTVSPDRMKVAFEVMGGNLHVMHVDGTGLVDLGRGSRPQWGPDSEHLVYMLTKDDGHQFLSADLHIIKIDGSGRVAITNTDEVLEMNPSWSIDNKIAFDVMDEGAIYVMEIAREATGKQSEK